MFQESFHRLSRVCRIGSALAVGGAAVLAGCGTSNNQSSVRPTSSVATTLTTPTPTPTPSTTATTTDAELVWVGTGEAFRFENGSWVRSESLDYEFEVRQVRTASKWSSTKNLHRTRADYDGSAGARDQVLRFALELGSLAPAGTLPIEISSTIGPGTGIADSDFREMGFTLSVAPSTSLYNTFRITQHYGYEQGQLTETVDLFARDNAGNETPVFQMREQASLFAGTKFDTPPTRAA
jgi:hypothetical protein